MPALDYPCATNVCELQTPSMRNDVRSNEPVSTRVKVDGDEALGLNALLLLPANVSILS